MQLTINQPSVAAAVNQEELCNSIIDNLNTPELSPLERYAIANMLAKAADAAAKILSNYALQYALRNPTANDPNECYVLASAGRQFVHRGFVYGVTKHPKYNYAQPDEHGREWVSVGKEIESLREKASAKSKYRTALQGIILAEHNLKPINSKKNEETGEECVPMTLSFHPSGFDNNEAA